MNDYDKYNDKYLKYKNKYLELKQYAGSPPAKPVALKVPTPKHEQLIYFCNNKFIDKLCPTDTADNTWTLKKIEQTLYTDCYSKERRNIAFKAKNGTHYLQIIYKPEWPIDFKLSRIPDIPDLTDGLNLYDIIRKLKNDASGTLDNNRHQNLSYFSTPLDFKTITSAATEAINKLSNDDYTYVPPIAVPIEDSFSVPTNPEVQTNIKFRQTGFTSYDDNLFKNVIMYIRLYMSYFHPTFDKIDSCFIVNVNKRLPTILDSNECLYKHTFLENELKYT